MIIITLYHFVSIEIEILKVAEWVMVENSSVLEFWILHTKTIGQSSCTWD